MSDVVIGIDDSSCRLGCVDGLMTTSECHDGLILDFSEATVAGISELSRPGNKEVTLWHPAQGNQVPTL